VSIQIAISKTVNAIATNMIDLKHGRAILYGLHLAATNARRLNPVPEPQAVVRELTTTNDDYDTPADIAPEGATTELDTTDAGHPDRTNHRSSRPGRTRPHRNAVHRTRVPHRKHVISSIRPDQSFRVHRLAALAHDDSSAGCLGTSGLIARSS
jgi:hypothetical protein